MTVGLVLAPISTGNGEMEMLAKRDQEANEKLIKKMASERNPAQDKPLSNGEIEKLKRNGWDHSDKGKRGGRSDLYKDKVEIFIKRQKEERAKENR